MSAGRSLLGWIVCLALGVPGLAGAQSDAFDGASGADAASLTQAEVAAPPRAGVAKRTRLVTGSTALTKPAGELGWEMSNIFMHEVQYGLTDNLQLGVRTVVPAVYVAALPSLKWGKSFGDRWRGALEVSIGGLWPYVAVEQIESVFTGRALLAGTGPLLTYVGSDLTFNFGLPVYYARYGHKQFRTEIVDKSPVTQSRVDFSNYVAALPHAGVVYHFSNSTHLHSELINPLGNFDGVGRLAVLFYGLRVFVERAYIDLTFALPLYPGMGGFLRVLPFGVPMATFGVIWERPKAPPPQVAPRQAPPPQVAPRQAPPRRRPLRRRWRDRR